MGEPAQFHEEREKDPRRPTHSIVTIKCECGWSTRARNSSVMFGTTNDRTLALLEHRIDHLEGRIDA